MEEEVPWPVIINPQPAAANPFLSSAKIDEKWSSFATAQAALAIIISDARLDPPVRPCSPTIV